ncbi:MAG: hypothetical protein JRJ47_07815 [Deltaproteobacteria bacterium]|nr:hypothetical protein [Deltaproteobacteria bacterium]
MTEDKENGVDALPTLTLAKLYEQQGFLDKAASVYKELLLIEPDRTELGEAIEAIERRLAGVMPLTKKV